MSYKYNTDDIFLQHFGPECCILLHWCQQMPVTYFFIPSDLCWNERRGRRCCSPWLRSKAQLSFCSPFLLNTTQGSSLDLTPRPPKTQEHIPLSQRCQKHHTGRHTNESETERKSGYSTFSFPCLFYTVRCFLLICGIFFFFLSMCTNRTRWNHCDAWFIVGRVKNPARRQKHALIWNLLSGVTETVFVRKQLRHTLNPEYTAHLHSNLSFFWRSLNITMSFYFLSIPVYPRPHFLFSLPTLERLQGWFELRQQLLKWRKWAPCTTDDTRVVVCISLDKHLRTCGCYCPQSISNSC